MTYVRKLLNTGLFYQIVQKIEIMKIGSFVDMKSEGVGSEVSPNCLVLFYKRVCKGFGQSLFFIKEKLSGVLLFCFGELV